MRIVLLCLGFLVGQSSVSQVLATVNNTKITAADFNAKFEELRKQSINVPSASQFLEELIRMEVGVQEAEKLKLQNDPVVKDRFKQVLYNALLEKELASKIEKIKVSDGELRDYYKKNPEIHLAMILVERKTDTEAASRKKAQSIFDDVKKSKRPFEELVHLYSEDAPTKENGGDIGFQSRGTLAPVLYDGAVNMKVGEVRGLIETPVGFHIFKLIEKRPFDLTDKRQIHAVLTEEKRLAVFNEYFARLEKPYKIEINREALKSLQ